MAKITLDDIRTELEPKGWTVNSLKYTNLKTEMTFTCDKGHDIISSWGKLRDKLVCPICKQNKFTKVQNEIQPKPKGTKRVLALDQATHTTGWSIFTDDTLTSYGTFEANADDEIARDNSVKKWVVNMLDVWRCDFLALEDIQLQQHGGKSDFGGDNARGVTVYKMLAHLQGILMEAAFELDIPYKLISPSTWRNYCGIKGKTRPDKKKSAQLMIKKTFDIDATEDEADAICIGQCAAGTTELKPQHMEW